MLSTYFWVSPSSMHKLHAKGNIVPLMFCWSTKQWDKKRHHVYWEHKYVLWTSEVKKDKSKPRQSPMFPVILTSTQRINLKIVTDLTCHVIHSSVPIHCKRKLHIAICEMIVFHCTPKFMTQQSRKSINGIFILELPANIPAIFLSMPLI